MICTCNLLFCFQGGEPDIVTVSKMVLNDWQRGKIPFFVKPPNCDKVCEICLGATSKLSQWLTGSSMWFQVVVIG